MKLLCGACRQEKESSEFYVKYKGVEPTKRSDWCGCCVSCMKSYKKRWYERNSSRVNKKNKDRRDADHERYLQLEAARRLKKSEDPDAVLRRRTIGQLDERERYLHDRTLQWKRSALKRGLEWRLSVEDVKSLLDSQAGLCYYTKASLKLMPGCPDTISLDRLDPSRGYGLDNVVLCTTRVNLAKLDMTPREFRELVTALHNNQSW